MRINVNDPAEFTLENLRKLMADGDDSTNTQYRVTKDGYLFLSKDVGAQNLDGISLRFETNGAYNGYTGPRAAENARWIERIYNAVKERWPNNYTHCVYIDIF